MKALLEANNNDNKINMNRIGNSHSHGQIDREAKCIIPAASRCVKTGSLTKWVLRNCQLSLMRFTEIKTKYY